MRITVLSHLGMAAALLFAQGCVDITQCQTSPGCPPATVDSAGPKLLTDAVALKPSPAPARDCRPSCPPPAPVRGARGADSERVFDLGSGVVANSNAVLMAGGRERPVATYRPGGALAGCPPPRDDERPARKPEPAKSPAPTTPAAPVASVTVREVGAAPVVGPEPVVVPAASSFQCPVLPGAETVCLPGDNLSECFTLTEEELRSGPPVYRPGTVGKYNIASEFRTESGQQTKIVIRPDSSAGATPASGREAAPAETPAIPTAPGTESAAKYDPLAPLRPLNGLDEKGDGATLAVPPPVVGPETIAPLAPPEEIVAAVVPRPVAPAAKAQDVTPPGTVAPEPKSEPLPPVPQVGDLQKEAERLLANPPADVSNLPEVELPPRLK